MTSTPDTAVRPGSDPDTDTDTDTDVVVVGFGPVGQTLTVLLAQAGHRVTVVERWSAVYDKPRAVAFDGEVARVLAAAGIADRFAEVGEPVREYEWHNADGATLLRFEFTEHGPSGWPDSTNTTQPLLEQALAERAAGLPGVTLLRSTEAVALTQDADGVEVVLGGSMHGPVRAAYVVGCDGANSFVRQRMDTTVTDLGFCYDWLIVDVVEHQPRSWSPQMLQVCDPARPTTLVGGGPGRRRWEFMRMPTDVLEGFDSDATAWSLLAPWGITPDNAALERRAVYTFQARWADRWQDGRLFVAGDAAHLMPPFAGQGMCSGIRDSANLAWKLDLVLRGVAGPELLGTYSPERSAHVQHAIGMSVELGKVICVTDPAAVAGRDGHLLAVGPDPTRALPPVPPARLGPGALQLDPGTGAPAPGSGLPGVQGPVCTSDGRTGLLDDVLGVGFHLLLDAARAGAEPDAGTGAGVLAALGAVVVPLVPAGGSGVQDLDGVLLAHLGRCGHVAQLVRPDGYLFGGVADIADLPELLAQLGAALHLSTRAPSPVAGMA